MRPQGEKMELHHKVPIFLGGSEEEWNLEWISTQEHLNRHIEIAEEIDTFEAWASVTQCLRGKINLIYDRDYILKRFGKSTSGKNHPMYGNKHSEETKKKWSNDRKGKPGNNKGFKHSLETKKKWSDMRQGKDHPMYGRTHTEETKQKISIEKIGIKNPKFKGYYNCGSFGKFESSRIAGKVCNLSHTTILHRMKSNNYKDWYFIPKGDKNEI